MLIWFWYQTILRKEQNSFTVEVTQILPKKVGVQ